MSPRPRTPASARAPKGAASPERPARPRPRKSSKKVPPRPAGVWTWKTPDEAWKTRWALKLIALTLALVALWGGEVQLNAQEWKVGLRNLQGRPWIGLTWGKDHGPRFWRAR